LKKLFPDNNNALDLIKEEIAIMKKLDHPNLVSLIEVLDDPAEDSLYMVLEMCKKGVVMKLDVANDSDDEDGPSGNEHRAQPYPDHVCRTWFRDLLLGIEYLHAQGIIHRDIKPDNCLITADDVLKVVDFGVSEMFDKASVGGEADKSDPKKSDDDLKTAKSAGSPAFMPPELCVARHGAISGRAADIWSMGVTLYCLRYGKIPFERKGVLELYESIRNDDVEFPGELDDDFRDLMGRLLEKDPMRRITMEEIRVGIVRKRACASPSRLSTYYIRLEC
jgi:[calcium/calmodulin-dependent protein kinase] kinase